MGVIQYRLIRPCTFCFVLGGYPEISMTVVDGYSHSEPTTKVNGSKLLTHQWPKPHIFGVRICICIHTYIHTLRMGTRLQYDLCSHVYSHYPSTAKGSLLPPLWLKHHCRSPEKTIANAEAVHLLLSLWLRTDHSCINKEHIHIGENLRFTGYQPYALLRSLRAGSRGPYR